MLSMPWQIHRSDSTSKTSPLCMQCGQSYAQLTSFLVIWQFRTYSTSSSTPVGQMGNFVTISTTCENSVNNSPRSITPLLTSSSWSTSVLHSLTILTSALLSHPLLPPPELPAELSHCQFLLLPLLRRQILWRLRRSRKRRMRLWQRTIVE